jgi:hypothetical protein
MQRASFGLAVAVIAVLVPACRGGADARTPAAAKPAVEISPVTPVPETLATFAAANGPAAFRLEIADTPAARSTGLMHRRALAPDRGMVFLFPSDQVQTFWMKNTLVPLDMVFVSAAGDVVGVVEDARPLTEEPRSVGLPSRYVVELNAFTARTRGIRTGTHVTFVPPLRAVDR